MEGAFGPLRQVVDDTDDPRVVPIRADLARWFREYAERAERGEIMAAGVALVLADPSGSCSSAWHDDQGNGPMLLGAVAVLQHRIASRLTGE